MEFWGAEVKPGPPLKVAPEEDKLIHISQATLDCKGKMGESVILTVTVDKKKFVIGTLSQEKFPQISFDLVFEKEFELSHNCAKGSVHFIGYRSPNIEQEEDDFFSGSDEEEEVPEAVPTAAVPANGNAGAAASNVVKADSKPKAKPAEVKPESDDDEDDSDEEDESDDDDDSEKGMDVDEDDSDDDEDSEDEEEEETPKKPEPNNKKRPNESASKTPVSGMKAKPAAAPAATPQKTEEKKKRGHTATPHPAKKGGKSPVNTNQSPKSGGQSSSGNKKKKKQSKKEDKPVKSDRFPEPAKKIIVKTSAVKMGPKRVRLSMKKTSEVAVIDESSSSSSMNNDFNKVKTFDIRGVTETAAK